VDIGWFKPDGTEMTEGDWTSAPAPAIGVFLNGDAIPDRDSRGQRIADDSFLLLFNGMPDPAEWTIPPAWPGPWHPALDTTQAVADELPPAVGERVTLPARSIVVLRRPRTPVVRAG
jgi:glycogen operon protein